MNNENKDLLLIDLLARLPYGVKIRLGDYDYQVCGYNSEKEMPVKIWYYYDSNLTLKSYIDVYLTDYCPYLRPISSMTEEEVDEFTQFDVYANGEYIISNYRIIDWLNKHHFDYRTNDEGKTMIEKGLALEAPEEMYSNMEKQE